jgi:hypothetical protein
VVLCQLSYPRWCRGEENGQLSAYSRSYLLVDGISIISARVTC